MKVPVTRVRAPVEATLHTDRSRQAVLIVGETARCYRIRAPRNALVRLSGRNRWLAGEQTALVPKPAISFV